MAKFDQEDLLDSILSIMTSNGALNACIAAVEAEKVAKGKGLTPALEPVAADAYYLQTWNDGILNTLPAIFYGIEDIQTVDGGGVAAKTYKVFVEVLYGDSGMTNDSAKRIARYARALEELFSEAFGSISNSSKIKIETVRPVSFKLEIDSTDEIKVGGVSLTITLV